MSRHRVKAISYDSDGLDDDDYDNEAGGDGGDNNTELSPEDREQMRLATIEVRQLLASEMPPVSAEEQEIWESLWHYYYDVGKAVGYLRKKYKPDTTEKSAKKQQQQGKVKGKGMMASSYPLPPPPPAVALSTTSCSAAASFSAVDFFKDSPWLNIPAHRRAEILVEPLYPRLGLLGGAPEGGGKMSKLAALAAARKKRESEKKMANGSPSSAESPSQTPEEEPRSTSISLLDRLGSGGRSSSQLPSENRMAAKLPLRKFDRGLNRAPPPPPPRDTTPKSAAAPAATAATLPERPLPKRVSPDHGKESTELAPPQEKSVGSAVTVSVTATRAEPSTFATTIVGRGRNNSTNLEEPSDNLQESIDVMSNLLGGRNLLLTEVFNFAGPSPDDVVLNAQSAAKGNKAKRSTTAATTAAAKAALKKKSPTDLADEVNGLSVQESVKVKSKNLDVLAEYRKAQRKKAANFVVIGHVDAGKSTLMGRLLFDLKAIDQRTMDKYRREADKIGKGSFALAWVLDQGSEERARGVTIDIATNKFETEHTNFTILDAPGHRDFVPNMIAGASQADFAVLVVDASTGKFESGLKGQTKEHALLVRSMGVAKIVVVVNKMDSVGWTKDRFDEIQQQISAFLTTAGFQPKNISFVPCSGLRGDNVTQRADDKAASWYTGRTLIEELETSEPYTYALDKPLRMTIADVFRAGVQNPLSISGRLDAGTLQVGDTITTMPISEKATIKAIEIDNGEPSDWAVAGQNVTLHLTDIDPTHLRTGDIICTPTTPIRNITSFTAKVLAFDHLTPMHIDVHRGRLHVPGRIAKLVAVLDKATGAAVGKKKLKIVAPGSVARIVVEMDMPIPLEAPGRVVLRAGGETVAAGLLE
ncbi:translation elongation factor Tu [Polytolypa hystricis UAMH7299]|uniref:Elongation factor 1 alpha-like protein n=1 Tax=Polytolypa hystricis (strain UAMH7299) TaxID=1447883 RepID=A0A2B7Z2W4_POLH7|nr:translation elongation factor Tu [Polytolypa hystricis UAMH7299]